MRSARPIQAGRNETRQQAATRRVALRLLAGIDVEDVDELCANRREQLLLRLDRLVERERLKGSQRHWSYDINRHIALADAARSLRAGLNADGRPDMEPPAK